jgi:hypothetical protein
MKLAISNSNISLNFVTSFLESVTMWGFHLEGDVGNVTIGTDVWTDDFDEFLYDMGSEYGFLASFDEETNIITITQTE